MGKCNISIDFHGDAEELIRSAGQAISGAGGIFTGNITEGQFSIQSPLGKISGLYTLKGQSFNIEIVDKPFLVSCSRIEDELRKQIR
jgi:hypothetical protein